MGKALTDRQRRDIQCILEYEAGFDPRGGYVNLNDGGGPTQWGIASNFHPKYAQDIRAKRLTKARALEFYVDLYQKAVLKYEPFDDRLQLLVLDRAVQGRTSEFLGALQGLIFGYGKTRVDITCRFDRQTVTAIRALPSPYLETLVENVLYSYPSMLHSWARKPAWRDGFYKRGKYIVNYVEKHYK